MKASVDTVQIEPLTQVWRILALVINIALAWAVFHVATGSLIPTGSGASVWFLAATAYWLLTLVAAPFFLPPRDALSSAISVFLLLAPLDLSTVPKFQCSLLVVNYLTLGLALFVVVTSLLAIFQQKNSIGRISYRLSSVFGRGEVLFTPAVLISALGFYQDHLGWMFFIVGAWTYVVAIHPTETAMQLTRYVRGLAGQPKAVLLAGNILRVDDPDIVRVVLSKGSANWEPSTVHVANLPNGKSTYVLPLFSQIQNDEMIGTGICCPCSVDEDLPDVEVGAVYAVKGVHLSNRLASALSGDDAINRIVGIVVEGSSIASIRFQVVPSVPLEEGMVVFACIRGKKVYYQILDANTSEENFQQNPYGVHIALAAQLGCYDEEKGFQKFPWLPNMNQPLFVASSDKLVDQKLKDNEFVIGHVPCTPFGVPVVLDDLIEYHTAVLGITGTGKTELALDIVRNAITSGAKVFCVDFTGEYKARLADQKPHSIGLSIKQGSDLEEKLFAVETGAYGAGQEKAQLKAFLDGVKPQVEQQVIGFLADSTQRLGIFELAEITNTKATLRTTELYLSAIMDWAKKNRKAERVLIVLEEAHTIVPEVFSAGFDHETQWVVGRIGQIALQGRKYGVGLLLVSQRTALVSKTVLSQCNTYFTHALVDKTSLEYLSGVYSAEHVKAIPNLRFLEFVAYGKGVKSERPLLARREFDQKKLDASQALNVKKKVIEGT